MPLPLHVVRSPYVMAFLLSPTEVDTELAAVVRRLEGARRRGLYRPVPVDDHVAYAAGMEDTLKQVVNGKIVDAAHAIIEVGGRRQAVRLIQRLTN